MATKPEVTLTTQQETILKIRLEGAAIFKKSKLTAGEMEYMAEQYLAEVDKANKEAIAKAEKERKEKEAMHAKRLAAMMPHDRINEVKK